jgi:prophage maintenance system killer protein
MFNDSDIFGTEKDASFKSSLGQIYQTFDGKELYPTAEIKAAMLLYLVVKNHSFVDGNKRIAAFVFFGSYHGTESSIKRMVRKILLTERS